MSQVNWLSQFSRPNYRTYSSAPLHLRESFLQHVRDTGRPEDFPGVCMNPVSKTEPFSVIASFEIEGRHREDGLKAPCPMCQHTNHYLKGALVYFLRLKVITPIGWECADKEVAFKAVAEERARRDRELEEDFLLSRIPLIGKRVAWMRRMESSVRDAETVYRKFRKTGGAFRRVLSAAIKNNAGSLIIHELRRGEFSGIGPAGIKSQGGVETSDVNFGPLHGTVALHSQYSPVREFDDGLRRLLSDGFDVEREISQLEAMDVIGKLDAAARRIAYVNQGAAEKAFRQAVSRLADFWSFFSVPNLARISSWAAHPESPLRFSAAIRADSVTGWEVFWLEGDKEACKIVLPYRLNAQMPPFPEAEA